LKRGWGNPFAAKSVVKSIESQKLNRRLVGFCSQTPSKIGKMLMVWVFIAVLHLPHGL
jgi:hypothetical protein